ncbi:MAG: hypothetical protein FWE06_06405 [Oscillospiraceae bacterium]|nr:hypothetical protein [Oscillospiraceae bacterium]
MPYKHAGEVGDVWKHMPLCEILKIEKPVKYHESNSAYSGYTISRNPKTEYGILKVLQSSRDDVFVNSEYCKILKANGMGNLRYTGSPGLAMETLSNKANYFFHDLEQEALNDVKIFAQYKELQNHVKTICGDSINAFLNNDYVIDCNDFIFFDPYCPFDKNEKGYNFFDIFTKAIISKSKILLWYGYESIVGQQEILAQFRTLANEHKIEIWSFDVWQKNMTWSGCEINPGVPGCGIACVNLSDESVTIIKQQLAFIENCYANAIYNGNDAMLLVETNRFHCT